MMTVMTVMSWNSIACDCCDDLEYTRGQGDDDGQDVAVDEFDVNRTMLVAFADGGKDSTKRIVGT